MPSAGGDPFAGFDERGFFGAFGLSLEGFDSFGAEDDSLDPPPPLDPPQVLPSSNPSEPTPQFLPSMQSISSAMSSSAFVQASSIERPSNGSHDPHPQAHVVFSFDPTRESIIEISDSSLPPYFALYSEAYFAA
jgi:hypothetical protein